MFISAHQLIIDSIDSIEKLSSTQQVTPYYHISTGFPDFDILTHGLRRGSLVVLAGSTGTGKTALAFNLARNISIQGEVAVQLCTLDSSPTALLLRMLSSISSIESGRIIHSKLTPDEWPRLGQAMAQLSAAPLFFSGQAIRTVAAIRARCQELAVQSTQPLGLVVIDSLQLLAGDPTEQLKELRLLAAELQACVLLTCQSLPSVELRPGGAPLLHDLPALEAMQTYPHVIGMLHREEFWNPDTNTRGEAQLIFFKNIDDPVGTLRFRFEPMFSRFLEAYVCSPEAFAG